MGLEIYIESNSSNEYNIQSILGSNNQNVVRQSSGKYVVNATCYEAMERRPAFVVFKFDPGLTTDKYYIYGLMEPKQITADTIPLAVSTEWELALIDGALGFIEYHDYGRSDRLQTFYDVWAVKYWNAYALATNDGVPLITPVRGQ
jgi:hypothetical protein